MIADDRHPEIRKYSTLLTPDTFEVLTLALDVRWPVHGAGTPE